MVEKVKAFASRVKSKAKVAVSAVAAAGVVALTPLTTSFADEAGTVDVWGTVSSGATSFLGVVSSVFNTCASNSICLAFLTVTFVGLGVRMVKRLIGAFGRGR